MAEFTSRELSLQLAEFSTRHIEPTCAKLAAVIRADRKRAARNKRRRELYAQRRKAGA